jgi:aryl-alcohol dehydrogenase-like predicted oxidoreductase
MTQGQMERIDLANGYSISRVIKGGWQLSGDHGEVDANAAVADMSSYYDGGITAFDCADVYTGVEEMIGVFREYHANAHGQASLKGLKVHTKFIPDLAELESITRKQAEATIDRSLRRLNMERLDLVQFHWWDYSAPRYVEVASWLLEFQKAGKIDLLGATNFDLKGMGDLLSAGISLASMQVQYSLLDQRPAGEYCRLASENGVQFLCYGTVAGGFLSDRWLDQPEPTSISNRSLIKYKLIIDDCGGWDIFQRLLRTLKRIALKHRVSIATIATRWVLDQENVAAAIVGVRRGNHMHEHLKLMSFSLDSEDTIAISLMLKDMKRVEGDVYEVERDIRGRHGSIMKYNLNASNLS